MAYPAVTYTFVDDTSLDATQLNQNFNDVVNGVIDGTKALNIKDVAVGDNLDLSSTVAITGATSLGTLSVTGATTLSNDVIIDTGIFKLLSFTNESITLVADAMTPAKSCVVINGEGGLADSLSTITATSFVDGSLLLLKRKSTSGDITVKNGVGNIVCGADRVLSTNSTMILLYDAIAVKWQQVFYAAN